VSDAPFRPPPPPVAVRKPPRGPVLVLAPHPDDETMGCGGTLALHARQGDPIHVLFVCSGIQGDPDGYFPREQLPALREAEAREAAADLGVGKLTFLGYPDNLSEADFGAVFEGLPAEPEAQRRALVAGFAEKLGALVAEERPNVVYYPWDGELNPDHWAVGQAVTLLRRVRPDLDAASSWMGYDVWTPSPADTVVDVSDAIEAKVRAVRRYRTQLHYRDYEPAVLGLDAYRAMFLETGATYGEGFVGRYRAGETRA
jgi:LmbE family N-acetylglucosaminyl deacetylase